MSRKKVYVPINQLEEGMEAAEQLSLNNIVLLNCNVLLTKNIIKKLQKSCIKEKILVYSQEEDENFNKDREALIKIENQFSEFSQSVESIFYDIDNSGKTNMDEIRSFANEITKELHLPSMIIKNIVLKGSGQDTIYRHSVNVAALSMLLGKWIGFEKNELNLLTYSAILHDFGKTQIDKEILYKKGRLTKEEFSAIKSHPIKGYELTKQVPFLDQSVGCGVLMHHERLDGSGYPLGIKEEKIHPFAKIIAVADTFDAINSDRVYRKKKGPFEALETIQKESLGKLDYKYSKIFIEHIVNYYTGENVILNNGENCKIIKVDVTDISKPLLLCDSEFLDLKKEKNLMVEKIIV